MFAIDILLRNGDRDDPIALTRILLDLKNGLMILAKLRRDGPASLLIAVDRPSRRKTVLAEVSRGVLQRQELRFRSVAYRCHRNLQFAHDKVAILRAAGPLTRQCRIRN